MCPPIGDTMLSYRHKTEVVHCRIIHININGQAYWGDISFADGLGVREPCLQNRLFEHLAIVWLNCRFLGDFISRILQYGPEITGAGTCNFGMYMVR